MMMYEQYICEHFSIQELVPPEVFQERGNKAWSLFNPLILKSADRLRKRYGPMFINTWSLSKAIQEIYGTRTESGIRIPGNAYYKVYSDHSRGNAFDAIFRDISAEEIRDDIIQGRIEFDFPVVIECTINGKEISWLHFATRNMDSTVMELHL